MMNKVLRTTIPALLLILCCCHLGHSDQINCLTGLVLDQDSQRQLHAGIPVDTSVQSAIDLYNAGNPVAAEQIFLGVADQEMRAAGVAWCVGHLNYIEQGEDTQRAGDLLIALADSNPGNARLSDYRRLGQEARNVKLYAMSDEPSPSDSVSRILQMGEAHNPFYDKALFYKARKLRAGAQEGYDQKILNVANTIFAQLLQVYPEQPSLKELVGGPQPWGEKLIDDTSDAPAWARYLRELYGRQCAILEWWFTQRQMADGSLGGGWGDDVEILRDWILPAMICDASPEIRAGIQRLADGIWDAGLSDWGYYGWADVAHSSEPSADTSPLMMYLRWGDPLYYERNQRSAKTIRDYFMGIDNKGYYRFKSAYFGINDSNQPDTNSRGNMGGDNGMCTRPMKHLAYLATYGNLEAERVYLDWVQGWYDATMSPYQEKPVGIVPSNMYYPSGDPSEPGCPWYQAACQYYPSGVGQAAEMLGAFQNVWSLTDDYLYFEPTARYLQWTSFGPLLSPGWENAYPIGSPEWVISGQQYSGNLDYIVLYRLLTGDTTADSFMTRYGDNQMARYYISRDLEPLMQAIEFSARNMRTGFLLRTMEALQTDRARLDGSLVCHGAYTGGLTDWRGSKMPSMAVTWDATNTNWAALVTDAEPRHMRVWLYNFNPEPMRLGLHCWRLDPGVYALNQGELLTDNYYGDRYRVAWDPADPYSSPATFPYRRRRDGTEIIIPPGKAWCVDVRWNAPLNQTPADLAPDAAIADRDLSLSPAGDLTVTLHNIGTQALDTVAVLLETGDGLNWTPVSQTSTGPLASPELDPVTANVVFPAVPPADQYRVTLDPDQLVDELYEGNNIALLNTIE